MPQSRIRLARLGLTFRLGLVCLAASLVSLAGCGGDGGAKDPRAANGAAIADGLDPSAMPASVRDDYRLFATRCSKCHALARPLKSGIRADADWAMLVDRMRRQEGSGISREDADHVLRFLHYYSTTNGI